MYTRTPQPTRGGRADGNTAPLSDHANCLARCGPHRRTLRRRGAAPAGADHEENPRQVTQEVGFNALNNKGFNTDVWTQVPEDGRRVFGYTGTWGTLTALGADLGQECPSETEPNPVDPQQSGVWVVDATDPTGPQVAAKIPVRAQVPGVAFFVEVVDNGEPRREDTFRIVVAEGYGAFGTLSGGNIQVSSSVP